jgi:predicted GNAT family acetyltransferase
MGIFHDQKIARYQSVETRASHRKRGICSALLRHSALWALGRAPNADVLIVAEADSNAGRLYRNMGFAHAETIFGVARDGY